MMYAMVLGPIEDTLAQQLVRSIVYQCRFRPSAAELNTIYHDIRMDIPGPEAAWAMMPKSEAETIVWTDEMREAFAAAAPLIESGDQIAARMTFIETYRKSVNNMIVQKRSPRWSISIGTDPASRAQAIANAVEAGRISADIVKRHLPDIYASDDVQRILPEHRREQEQQAICSEKRTVGLTDVLQRIGRSFQDGERHDA